MLRSVYKVAIIESEAGWGQRIDEVKKFKTKKAAEKFVADFNSENTEKVTPSWYMRAELCP